MEGKGGEERVVVASKEGAPVAEFVCDPEKVATPVTRGEGNTDTLSVAVPKPLVGWGLGLGEEVREALSEAEGTTASNVAAAGLGLWVAEKGE